MSVGDLVKAVSQEFPPFTIFEPATCLRLSTVSMGGMVARVQVDAEMLAIAVWRAKTSINILLDKKVRLSLLMRLVGMEKANALMEAFGSPPETDNKLREQSGI